MSESFDELAKAKPLYREKLAEFCCALHDMTSLELEIIKRAIATIEEEKSKKVNIAVDAIKSEIFNNYLRANKTK